MIQYRGQENTVLVVREAVLSLSSNTAHLKEMPECHMEWKKGTWDTALQAQMSYRTSEAPLQSSAFLGIMRVLLDHMPPPRKSSMLSVGGFIEFQQFGWYRTGGKASDITSKSES